MHSLARRTTTSGFTLVELLVALAVAIILLSVGIPSWLGFLANNRLSAQANDMVGAFSLARSEAINRRAEVRVVPVDAADWSRGWSVLADVNKDGDYADAADVLRLSAPLEGGSALTADAANTLSNAYVAFNSRGALQPLGDAFAYRLAAPDCGGAQLRVITVETTGRVSATRSDCP